MENTNLLLKKVVSNADRYNKNNLINVMKVDVENCHPINFENETYSYKQHGNCLFLYIDEDYQVMGILKGSTHKKEFSNAESYDNNPNWYNGIIKNRKHLEPKAKYILMFTPSMRTYKPKHNNRKRNKSHKDKLQERLLEYKKQKYNNINHQQLILMSKSLLNYFVDNLFTSNETQILEKVKKVDYWNSDNLTDVIQTFSNIVKDYKRYYDESQQEIFSNYYESNLKNQKIKIIKWYKTIFDKKQLVKEA
ncbi:MAG: hypothetical protein ACOC2W_00685 [bacterium]